MKKTFLLLMFCLFLVAPAGHAAQQNEYNIQWKMTLNGKNPVRGNIYRIKARSESEAIAKATKKIESSQQTKLKKGYKITTIIAVPK